MRSAVIVCSVLAAVACVAGFFHWIEWLNKPPTFSKAQEAEEEVTENLTPAIAQDAADHAPPTKHYRSMPNRPERRRILQQMGFTLHAQTLESGAIDVFLQEGLDPAGLVEWVAPICETVTATLGLKLPSTPLTIAVCSDPRMALAVSHRIAPSAFPAGVGGVNYGAQGLSIMAQVRGARLTLCHEIVHWIVASRFPDCPAVLEEGLACYLSEVVISKALLEEAESVHRQLGGPPVSKRLIRAAWRQGRLRQYAKGANIPSIETVATAARTDVYGGSEEARLMRDLSFCMVQVMCTEQETTQVWIRNVLLRIQNSADPAQELVRACRKPAFEEAWKRTVRAYKAPRFTSRIRSADTD